MENKESYFSASDEVDPTQPQSIVRLTSTEPYPGPGLIESATQLVKNWVRQGYNDLIAGKYNATLSCSFTKMTFVCYQSRGGQLKSF